MQLIIITKKHITTIPVVSGVDNKVNLYTCEGFVYPLTKEEKAVIKTIYNYPSVLTAPIEKDQEVGEVKISLFDEIIHSIPIYSIEEVGEENLKITIEKLIKSFIK